MNNDTNGSVHTQTKNINLLLSIHIQVLKTATYISKMCILLIQ